MELPVGTVSSPESESESAGDDSMQASRGARAAAAVGARGARASLALGLAARSRAAFYSRRASSV